MIFIRFLVKCIKSTIALIKRLSRPLAIISSHKASFFVWFLFTLFGGLAGVVISIMRHMWFCDTTYSFKQALYLESTTGSLYTYSITTIAAVLSGLFVLFGEREKLSYRNLQLPTAAISVFVLLFGGVFYSLNNDIFVSIQIPSDEYIKIDWKQVVIIGLSLLLSIYSFCLCRIDDHEKEFEEIKDQRFYKNNTNVDNENTKVSNSNNSGSNYMRPQGMNNIDSNKG